MQPLKNQYPGHGDQQGNNADEGHGGQDAHGQKSEGQAHGQSVDAGGQGQRQHGAEAEGGVGLLFVAEGFPYHIAADQSQQDEGDPVVEVRDIGGEPGAQKISQQGHQSLEAAEPETGGEGFFHFYAGQGQAFADGHSKGVHGQAHGQQDQFR